MNPSTSTDLNNPQAFLMPSTDHLQEFCKPGQQHATCQCLIKNRSSDPICGKFGTKGPFGTTPTVGIAPACSPDFIFDGLRTTFANIVGDKVSYTSKDPKVKGTVVEFRLGQQSAVMSIVFLDKHTQDKHTFTANIGDLHIEQHQGSISIRDGQRHLTIKKIDSPAVV